MEAELVAVVADEHQTRIFYTDSEGQKRAFVVEEVGHHKFIERVYDHWIKWHQEKLDDDKSAH